MVEVAVGAGEPLRARCSRGTRPRPRRRRRRTASRGAVRSDQPRLRERGHRAVLIGRRARRPADGGRQGIELVEGREAVPGGLGGGDEAVLHEVERAVPVAAGVVHEQSDRPAVELRQRDLRGQDRRSGARLAGPAPVRPVERVVVVAGDGMPQLLGPGDGERLIGVHRVRPAVVRGTEDARSAPGQCREQVVRPVDLEPGLPPRHHAEVGVRQAVVRQQMPFADDPADELRVLGAGPAGDEERGADVGAAQDVEQLRGPLRVRAVVEGQQDPVVGVGVAVPLDDGAGATSPGAVGRRHRAEVRRGEGVDEARAAQVGQPHQRSVADDGGNGAEAFDDRLGRRAGQWGAHH